MKGMLHDRFIWVTAILGGSTSVALHDLKPSQMRCFVSSSLKLRVNTQGQNDCYEVLYIIYAILLSSASFLLISCTWYLWYCIYACPGPLV